MRTLPILVTAVLSSVLTLAVWHLLQVPGQERAGAGGTGAAGGGASSLVREATSAPVLGGAGAVPLEPADENERRFLREALARERARIEAARLRPEDDGVDVVGRMLDHGADVTPLLEDFERFQTHVRRDAAPPVRYGASGELTTIRGEGRPSDPLVIELGPGRFKFERVLDYRSDTPVVDSIEVRGAGMDRTTLVASSQLVRVRTRSLRLSDLTLEATDSSAQIMSAHGDVAIVLENVRVEATGPQRGSAALYLAGRFYLGCRGCEFRRLASAVRILGEGVALFERCTFVDLEAGFMGWNGAAARTHVTLRNCEWRDSPAADSRLEHRGAPEYVMEVDGGSVALGREGLTLEERRKRWGAQWVREARAPTFRSSDATVTLGVLLRILEEAPVEGRLPVSLRLRMAPRERPARYLLTAWDPVRRREYGYDAWVDSGRVHIEASDTHDGAREPPEGVISLAQAIRACGEPLASPAGTIVYDSRYDGSTQVPAVVIQWYGATLVLRAKDGQPLATPYPSSW